MGAQHPGGERPLARTPPRLSSDHSRSAAFANTATPTDLLRWEVGSGAPPWHLCGICKCAFLPCSELRWRWGAGSGAAKAAATSIPLKNCSQGSSPPRTPQTTPLHRSTGKKLHCNSSHMQKQCEKGPSTPTPSQYLEDCGSCCLSAPVVFQQHEKQQSWLSKL